MQAIKKLDEIIEQVSPQMSQEEIEAEVRRLANNAHIDPATIKIEKTALNWAHNCLLVELNIGRARFERALTAPDLGLDEKDEALKDYIATLYPGRQILVGGEYRSFIKQLDNIENKARRVINKYSVKTKLGYAVSCVPKNGKTPFEELVEHIDNLEREYRAVYSQLIELLYEIKEETQEILWNASEKIYLMIKKNGPVPEEFKKNFVKRAMQNFPSREYVESMYTFKLTPKFVPLAQAEYEMRDLRHKALSLRSEVIESIKASYKEQVEGFVEDILSYLRKIIYETVVISLEALQKNGSLPGPSITSLQKMIVQVKNLNFANDQDVARQIESLQIMLNKAEKRDPDEIRKLLQDLREENRRFLNALGYEPRTVKTKIGKKIVELEPIARVQRKVRTNAIEPTVSEVEAVVRRRRAL